MRLVRDAMSHRIMYVTRDATVRTAVELLRAHQMDALPVVDEGRIVGLLEALHVALYEGEVSVLETLREPALTLPADTPLSEAAREMRSRNVRHAPVLHEGRLVGVLSDRDLLNLWGAVEDSLTSLPLQHDFRRWVALRLASGWEVAVVFVDLDGFGQINKRFGHVFGDRVLRRVAQVIADAVDPESDYACRYGGDEFAVATTRRLPAALALGEGIRDRVSQLRFEEQGLDVRVAVGLAGGQRDRPRPEAHVDSMLDDLINRASTASTAAKQLAEHIFAWQGAPAPGGPTAETSPERLPGLPRVMLQGYSISHTGESAEVSVKLLAGERLAERRSVARGDELPRVLASTTARCLEDLISRGAEVELEDTYEFTTPRGMHCVGATILLRHDERDVERLIGASPIRDDPNRAYISAVLDATNRRLSYWHTPGD